MNVKTFVTYLGAALLAMANPRWSTAQVHLVGVMPTVDVGMPLGEHWFIEKYFFDSEDQVCKPFIWGGCEGTVPFDTIEECQQCECHENGG